MDKLVTDILTNFQSEESNFEDLETILRAYLQSIISEEDLDNQVQKFMILITNEYSDYIENDNTLNKDDLKVKIIDFINGYKIFRYLTVDTSHKSVADFISENNISSSDNFRILRKIKDTIISKWFGKYENEKERLVNGSGNLTKSQLDEFLSANKIINSGDIENYFQTYDKFGEIWKYLLFKWEKEYNNFTPRLIQEFLSMYPVISETYIKTMLEYYSIFVYPDPIMNEHSESLDREGNVLPNCALCGNILNINLPRGNDYYARKITCGGIFHSTCIASYMFKNSICPICEAGSK
jgi:hypothetical protein